MSNVQPSALLTDLYQLTMLQAYHHEGMEEIASFELFVRKLPPGRNFLVAAGLEQTLAFLESFRFTEEECEWLRGLGLFSGDFLDYLARLRFSGEVHALPEGTVFFENEPVLRVSAPISQAQIVETRLINLIQFQTLIASKAARSVLAAPGRLLVDFGLRRAHGFEAGLLAARASYLAGFAGTSNVLAGKEFDIPVYGTMAHSYIMAHDDEETAFERFAEALPGNVVLLIDTYDTLAAARKLVALAPRLAARGTRIRAVRLDSGDLADLARGVRGILDAGGLGDCQIFASGDLDEFELKKLLDAGAPIGGFGVGTRLTTSADAPFLNCAYKLQEYAGRPRRKWSKGKETWPGRRQVYRYYDDAGLMARDELTLEGDERSGEALLRPVMGQGRRLAPAESLQTLRARVAEQLERLPPSLRDIEKPTRYPVCVADALRKLAAGMASPA